MKMLQNKDQERARKVFEAVSQITDKELGEKYRSLVLNESERIHQCGFLQTLAFHLSKKDKPEHKLFLQHILGWLFGTENQNINQKYHDLLQESSAEILLHTEETFRYLYWLKRFVEKFKKTKVNQNPN